MKPLLVKIGGSTFGQGDSTVEDLAQLQRKGVPTVVVHGGGREITRWQEVHGIKAQFFQGLRVTDEASLAVVVAVLAGLVNKQLVSLLQASGVRAWGLSGADGALIQCRLKSAELGLVGEVAKVDSRAIRLLLDNGYMPVIAPIGFLPTEAGGPALLNINGDTAAGELALALEASRLIFLTDVPGVLDTQGRPLTSLTVDQARALLASGAVSGGMIPKLEACLKALEGVNVAQIVDGRQPHALLETLDKLQGGTTISKKGVRHEAR